MQVFTTSSASESSVLEKFLPAAELSLQAKIANIGGQICLKWLF